MIKNYLITILIISFCSCKNEQVDNKILSLENEKLRKEIEINKLKDSLKELSKAKESQYITTKNSLDYIKGYSEKYPNEVKLYEEGVLHDKILKLIGKNNYIKFY